MSTCVICLESGFDITAGLCCSSDHFICQRDFSLYMSENVLAQVFKLRSNKGKVTCPCLECTNALNTLKMFKMMELRERSRYISILFQITHDQSGVIRLRDAILDILTLKCPKCKIAVDPLPDACSAVMCLNCGIYYCNYCYKGFDCGDTQLDRKAAHEHVATHKDTAVLEERDAFLSEACIKAGQKAYQMTQLHRCLLLAMTSVSFGLDGRHDVCLALVLCYADLESLEIDVQQAWQLAELELLGRAGQTVVGATSYVPTELLGVPSDDDEGNSRTVSDDYDIEPVDNNLGGAIGNTADTSVPPAVTVHNRPAAAEESVGRGGRQLANAIHSLNSVAVAQILQAFGAELDVNYFDAQSGFPLASIAILAGQEEAALRLVALGADLFQMDRNRRCVLFIAIESGNKKLVEFILQTHRNLDLNRPVSLEVGGFCPIHVAVRYNHGHLIRVLIGGGASLDVEESECHHSPLSLALILQSDWAATELVLQGADFATISPSTGRSPLYIAAEKGMNAMISLVRRQAVSGDASNLSSLFDVNRHVSTTGMLTLLQVACLHQQTHTVAHLIDLGADMEALNSHGNTPLTTSLLGKNSASAALLVRAGCAVHTPSRDGHLPIYLAIEHGMEDVVTQLLSRGVDINRSVTITERDLTPLHMALLYKHHHLVAVLLGLGADVNAVEFKRGLTPLLLAVVLRDEMGVRLLAPYQPDTTAFNSQNRNCLFVAAETGNSSILGLLLTKWNLDVNAPTDRSGHTALHVACMFDMPHTVRYLLQIGASVTSVDAQGRTPLNVAREGSSFAAEAVLVAFAADEKSSTTEEECDGMDQLIE